ncbi:MAG: sugar phosphate nucleotidyltransferase [Bacteroidota bacterium]
MKVVLFCGGLGMRMRDYSQTQPKPMAMLRNRPLIWHVMRWYAHWGHKDFILCLGHRGEAIKEYFLGYNEALSNDFVLTDGGRRVDLLAEDIRDWRITFVDTGLNSNIGERLRRVKPYLAGEDTFLANYSDGLSDIVLPRVLDRHRDSGAVATFLAVRPSQSFHVARMADDGTVAGILDVKEADMWINGGFFVLDQRIFDVMAEGEELVLEPFQRLIERGRLSAFRYEGFWRAVDTFKDLTEIEALLAHGPGPWEAWRSPVWNNPAGHMSASETGGTASWASGS